MKKSFKTLVIGLALISAFVLGAHASSTLEAISAYLNYGITIEYDGKTQEMFDANGVRIYPISYQGSTYVPIRAISNILGVDVNWDGENQKILLGTPAGGIDLINTFQPFSNTNYSDIYTGYTTFSSVQTTAGKTQSIGGMNVDHWINLNARHAHNSNGYMARTLAGYFNISHPINTYSTVTFKVCADQDVTLEVRGNNDTVLAAIPVAANQVPAEHTVPLAGSTQLGFATKLTVYPYSKDGPDKANVYIIDAFLE